MQGIESIKKRNRLIKKRRSLTTINFTQKIFQIYDREINLTILDTAQEDFMHRVDINIDIYQIYIKYTSYN